MMLVLTRRLQEKIRIDGHIVVTVVQISARDVKLGIDAPREVHVIREELANTRWQSVRP